MNSTASAFAIVSIIFLVSTPIIVESMRGCHGASGPILCNYKFYEMLLSVCDELPTEALSKHPKLSQCCCSVGCTGHFLKKHLCPDVE